MQNIIIFQATNDDKGLRIDKYLISKNINISRSKLQKLINLGKVTSFGNTISKNYLIKGNEQIEIHDFSLPSFDNQIKPYDRKLKILYEDDQILAISKDAGVVVHPAPGHFDDTLINAIVNYDKRFNEVGGNLRAGIVHRLDKDTSGIILIAKDDDTHNYLSEEFKERQVKKTYEALVLGHFDELSGIINMPIGRSKKDRKKMGIDVSGRKSLTEFKIIKEFKDCTLINVYPKTGRTHQIRVHFSFIGHPIIGDKDYGNKDSDNIAKRLNLKRQFLHAKRLVFIHPSTNKEIDIIDELPKDLQECLEKLQSE